MKRSTPDCGAFEQGMRLLARREHSRHELACKLRLRAFDDVEIQQAIDLLEDKGYQSDARFCEAYVHAKRSRGFGPLKIRLELEARGVDSALVDQHLDFEDWDWRVSARSQYRKRFGSDIPNDHNERVRRARFLLQRGFLSEQVKWAMRSESNED